MLIVKDLINISYIPVEEDISLQLYVDFYEQYLCKKIFIFTLKNGTQVKLFFKDTTEIFHVSGIEHIYDGIPMDGKRFVELVKAGKIDIPQLKTINASAYKDYVDRICSFACIDTLIKNCEYLWYTDGVIPGSNIKVKYLLLKGLDKKNIHLGIDTYKENRPYFSRTLLVTEGNSSNKFIEKADERLRVSKIEIVEKDTNEVVECIEREEAERKSHELINKKLFEWEKVKLANYLEQFYMVISKEPNIRKEVLSIIMKDKEELLVELYTVISKHLDIMDVLNEICLADKIRKIEWEIILLDEVKETIEANIYNNYFWEQFVSEYCFEEFEKYLQEHKGKFIKLIAIPEIKVMLDSEKQNIRAQIDSYDKYWSGKIVGEIIREKQKDYIKSGLDAAVQNILDENTKKHIKYLMQGIPEVFKEMLKNEYVEIIFGNLLMNIKPVN